MTDEASPAQAAEDSSSPGTAMPEQPSPRKRRQSSADDDDSSKRQRVEEATDGDETPRESTTYTVTATDAAVTADTAATTYTAATSEIEGSEYNQGYAVTAYGGSHDSPYTFRSYRRSPTESPITQDAREDAAKSDRYVTPSTPTPLSPSVFSDAMVPPLTYGPDLCPPLSKMAWNSTDLSNRQNHPTNSDINRYAQDDLHSLFYDPSDATPRDEPAVASPERSPVSFRSPIHRPGEEPHNFAAKKAQGKRTWKDMVERHESPPAPVRSTASAAATQSSTSPTQSRPRRFIEDTAVAKRLFGGISIVTGQSRTSAIQERRAEIEQRARERQQQREEEAARERKRIQRRRQQEMQRKAWEDRRSAMHLHHDALIEMAHSFRTETQPTIYYRPYQLTADEESQIAQQVREAYDVRDREEEDFERRYNEWRDRQRGGRSERGESPTPPRRSHRKSDEADVE